MFDPLLMVLPFAGFVVAVVVSYSWTRSRKDTPAQALANLPSGSPVRLKTDGDVYRTRYLGSIAGKLCFAAPLSRDRLVPLRVGEPVTVEAPAPQGVILFRSAIVERDSGAGTLTLEAPEFSSVLDRREGPRRQLSAAIEVESHAAALVDVSERGLRFRSSESHTKGERIAVCLPGQSVPAAAWVIEHVTLDGRALAEYRALFEEPADLGALDRALRN